MPIRISFVRGWAILLLILFAPAVLTAYFFHSAIWLVLLPLGLIVLAVLVALIPHKRKVTPEQFADEIERHLLGTDGQRGWDDTTSVAIADERLEQIRWGLPKFDSLKDEKDRDELKALIAALRRGEFPGIVPVTDLTYRGR
jgi:hypothetical protein